MAERRSVAADVVGSNPTSRPNPPLLSRSCETGPHPLPRAAKSSPPAAAATLAPSAPHLHIGTSGWAYATWKPAFYPADTPSKAFLHAYAARLNSVEVNYTFASTCDREQLLGWIAATPPGFLFSFKAPQRITHFQRLIDSSEALNAFLATLSPVRKAARLGVILFQLPPNFKLNLDRLRTFLALPALRRPGLRFAIEFRHESWFTEETYALLRHRNIALCIAESEKLTTPKISTATHSYIRLRMPGGYTPATLRAFAQTFAANPAETFVYLKHEDEPHGPRNALHLQRHAHKLCAGGAA